MYFDCPRRNSGALARGVLPSQTQFGHFCWRNGFFLALSQRECLKYSTHGGVVNRPVISSAGRAGFRGAGLALAARGGLARAMVVGGGALLRAVGGDALGERVAVDAERDGGAREVFLVARERLLDVELLELGDGLVEHDLAVEHFVNQGFESGAHLHEWLRALGLESLNTRPVPL